MNTEIACPKCNWKPSAGSVWQCSCGCLWNTFDTHGVCPACNKRWMDTQCLARTCQQWSKHVDWYKNLADDLKKEIEEILKSEPVTSYLLP